MDVAADNEPTAIWESQQVRFLTLTHARCVGNDLKRFFKQPCNILGTDMCCGLICSAFGSHIWQQKRRDWIHSYTFQGNIKVSACVCVCVGVCVCVWFSSHLTSHRQTRTLFCLSVNLSQGSFNSSEREYVRV